MGCFSYYGVGKLVFIDDTMDSAKYVQILSNNLFESAALMGLKEFIFQQDNDPKHTSRLTNGIFREKNLELLPWPAQSPDMNPIENLWGLIKSNVSMQKPKNIKELKDVIKISWEGIRTDLTKKLAESFQKRAIALYKANGESTKY